MTLSHIVAVSENDVIGTNNTLPWDIPEDMKFFRDKTKGHALIMGRKTFESVGHPLPNRLNVVVSRNQDFKYDAPNVAIQPDLKSAVALCGSKASKYGDEVFIIGGGDIFKQSMSMVNVIYLTRIHQEFIGDIYYPKISLKEFELIERRDRTEPVPFSFLTYMRRQA